MIFIIIVLLLRVCYTDVRNRIIENKCVIAIFLVNLLCFIINRQLPYFLSALIVFFVGVICVLTHCVGAGDAKLLAVLGMTFPLRELPDFIFLVAVSGLPLILITYCVHWLSNKKFSKTLPYGVAITSGYLLKILI